MNEPTSLASALAARRFALTAEIAPPLSCDPDDVIRLARPLKGLADAVNVTDGAGARAHLGAVTAVHQMHTRADGSHDIPELAP